MTNDELKICLAALGISQVELSRLIGVTARAVSLWMTGDRAIPGPAQAYVRLLQTLPMSLRQIELNRLKERTMNVRDGIYDVRFMSTHDAGHGVFIMDGGRVYGGDVNGCEYNGDYTFNEVTGCTDIAIKLTFEPHSESVFGMSNPYEWSIDATTSMVPEQKKGRIKVVTSMGNEIFAEYNYMRSLPDA